MFCHELVTCTSSACCTCHGPTHQHHDLVCRLCCLFWTTNGPTSHCSGVGYRTASAAVILLPTDASFLPSRRSRVCFDRLITYPPSFVKPVNAVQSHQSSASDKSNRWFVGQQESRARQQQQQQHPTRWNLPAMPRQMRLSRTAPYSSCIEIGWGRIQLRGGGGGREANCENRVTRARPPKPNAAGIFPATVARSAAWSANSGAVRYNMRCLADLAVVLVVVFASISVCWSCVVGATCACLVRCPLACEVFAFY